MCPLDTVFDGNDFISANGGHNMKIRKSDVEVDTGRYEFAHGRAPRGRGSWAFSFYGEEGLISQVYGPANGGSLDRMLLLGRGKNPA
jgi:hypothetical protein